MRRPGVHLAPADFLGRRKQTGKTENGRSWVTLQGPGEAFPLLTSISDPLRTGLGESNSKESGGPELCAVGHPKACQPVGAVLPTLWFSSWQLCLLLPSPFPPSPHPPSAWTMACPAPPTGHCFAFRGTQMTEPPQKIQRPNSPT